MSTKRPEAEVVQKLAQLQKERRQARKLLASADLSYITSERHGKLVDLVEALRRTLGVRA